LPDFEHDITAKTVAIEVTVSIPDLGMSLILNNFRFIKIEMEVVNLLFFFDFYTSFANNGYFQPFI